MTDWRITCERSGIFWCWEVYHSGYGWASGRELVKYMALREAKLAIGDLVSR